MFMPCPEYHAMILFELNGNSILFTCINFAFLSSLQIFLQKVFIPKKFQKHLKMETVAV